MGEGVTGYCGAMAGGLVQILAVYLGRKHSKNRV